MFWRKIASIDLTLISYVMDTYDLYERSVDVGRPAHRHTGRARIHVQRYRRILADTWHQFLATRPDCQGVESTATTRQSQHVWSVRDKGQRIATSARGDIRGQRTWVDVMNDVCEMFIW